MLLSPLNCYIFTSSQARNSQELNYKGVASNPRHVAKCVNVGLPSQLLIIPS